MSQDARETKAYPEYSKQTLKSWTSYKFEIVIIGPKQYQGTHFVIYHWEFTDGFFQEKPNADENIRIRTSVEVRNCTKSESLSKGHGRESLIFQIYVTFSIDFPNIYNDYLLANVADSFLLLFW